MQKAIYLLLICNALAIIPRTGESYDTSLALDADGKAHIGYFYSTNRDLKYATNKSGAWVMETLGGVVGYDTSLALDADGKAHISYFYSTNRDLKYATNKSGAWVTETVDSEGYVGPDTSLALDSEEKAHISYYDWNNDDPKYATNKSGAWVTETVDSEGYVGSYTSLALDSEGKVHISYYDGTNDDLKYATNKSGVWAFETVDYHVRPGDEGGPEISLALDEEGKAHISYYHDGMHDELKYATNKSGVWVKEMLEDYPTSYEIDIGGNGSFETGRTFYIDPEAPKVQVDFYIDNYSCPPDDDLFGLQTFVTLNESQIQVNSCTPNAAGGCDLSTSGCTSPQENVYSLICSNF
jgi:hypothetical protein